MVKRHIGLPQWLRGKESTCNAEMQEIQVQSLGWQYPLKERIATHSSILAWKIPMDRGALWATIHRVTKSQTQLKQLSTRALTVCMNMLLTPECISSGQISPLNYGPSAYVALDLSWPVGNSMVACLNFWSSAKVFWTTFHHSQVVQVINSHLDCWTSPKMVSLLLTLPL